MHDCFGKPITPGCKVRAATKEELEGQGHPEASYPTSLSPAEQFAFPLYFGAETCNVACVPDVVAKIDAPDAFGEQGIRLVTHGPYTTHTARALVRL